MNGNRKFLLAALSSGLSTQLVRPEDILRHATPEVLAAYLPSALTARILSAGLRHQRLSPTLVIETLEMKELAQHIPEHILWRCVFEAGEYALGDASVPDRRAKRDTGGNLRGEGSSAVPRASIRGERSEPRSTRHAERDSEHLKSDGGPTRLKAAASSPALQLSSPPSASTAALSTPSLSSTSLLSGRRPNVSRRPAGSGGVASATGTSDSRVSPERESAAAINGSSNGSANGGHASGKSVRNLDGGGREHDGEYTADVGSRDRRGRRHARRTGDYAQHAVPGGKGEKSARGGHAVAGKSPHAETAKNGVEKSTVDVLLDEWIDDTAAEDVGPQRDS